MDLLQVSLAAKTGEVIKAREPCSKSIRVAQKGRVDRDVSKLSNSSCVSMCYIVSILKALDQETKLRRTSVALQAGPLARYRVCYLDMRHLTKLPFETIETLYGYCTN